MNLSKRQREQQEKENTIIETAIELFCKYGYKNVTMDRIAQQSEFTKRTVYRYFSSKEDLFFAAALKGHQLFYKMFLTAIQEGDTGFDKVRLCYLTYYKFISTYPELAKLINQHRHSNSENIEQSSPFYQQFTAMDNRLFEGLHKIFVQGQEDGSIRRDLDIDQLAFSSIYIAVGFFQLSSFTGDTYSKHFGYEKDAFVKFSIERLLESIKA